MILLKETKKIKNITLDGVEEKVSEKTTEVALETLIKVDLEIDKKLHIFRLKINKNNNKESAYFLCLIW